MTTDSLFSQLKSPIRNMSRRDFLKFSLLMTSILAIPKNYVRDIAQALSTTTRLPVIWLEFQGCTGDTESFIRANRRPDPINPGVIDPSISEILLDIISLEYHETLMVPSGDRSEKSLLDTIQNYPGQYLCVVEGSIPIKDNGVYCTIGGRSALSIVQQACENARATFAVGSCAWDGGLAAAAPNPTGAVGVKAAVPGITNLINLPGCPSNVVNVVASVVHLITFNQLPDRDNLGRPYFAYGEVIHDECEREDFFEDGKYVLAWGDEGHRKGWCLYKMGCKGPATPHNCSTVGWNDDISWPVRSGHGCIGCASPNFWDAMTPFYKPVPNPD